MSEFDETPYVGEESESVEKPEQSEFVEKSKIDEKIETSEDQQIASNVGIGNVVASHYNNLQERGKAARSESRYQFIHIYCVSVVSFNLLL
jgi:hypothetical protein